MACRRYLLIFLALFVSVIVHGQYEVKGVILDYKKNAVPYANVSISELGISITADEQGRFLFDKIPSASVALRMTSLGYLPKDTVLQLYTGRGLDTFFLDKDNLSLKEVVVNAQKSSALSTSFVMGRTLMDNMQVLSAADVLSLLPGGKTSRTTNLAYLNSQPMVVNGLTSEMGNVAFGTALEVDGVRISNNNQAVSSSSSAPTGVDPRNIATSNIESIEVVTGIPSVEYGDVANGMVKINTRKGVSPWIVEALTQPNSKQISLNKGLSLGRNHGVVNVSAEHTRSVSDLVSPYTSYERNTIALNYNSRLGKSQSHPLYLDAGLSGNIGGYNSRSDPDLYVNTYTKVKDNVVRGKIGLRWIVNNPFLTSVEWQNGLNFTNGLSESQSRKSASSSVAALHTKEQGYHIGELYSQNPDADIILIPPGYWYEKAYDDSKQVNYSSSLKAKLFRQLGGSRHNLLLGFDYAGSKNNGKGDYYAEPAYAPTWRSYPYNTIPAINNYSIYAEDRARIKMPRHQSVELHVGFRSDFTSVKSSAYGTVGNFSPRVNMLYTILNDPEKKWKNLSLKLGWGKMVKLPSQAVLYPRPFYTDWLTFAPGTTADGQTFYAYYTQPMQTVYNPDLKYQYTVQKEFGINGNVDGNTFSLILSEDRTSRSYAMLGLYTPYTYKFTDQSALESVSIPVNDRIYSVDKNTGVVTVSDKTGAQSATALAYKEITRALSNHYYDNSDALILRRRIQWIIDFKEINALKTNLRVDGNYYYYKGADYTVDASLPTSTSMSDGNPYKYIGYYVGGTSLANGSVTKNVNLNITANTHIPSIRLIISTRLESSLYDYNHNLSQYRDGSQRGYILDSKNDYTPSSTLTGFYDNSRFVAIYPEYYVSLDDMGTKVPFNEKFLWAKDNDATLYNDLTKLVKRSSYDYYFNRSSLSFYYSANIAVTKEIGNLASITFRATNFFNNSSKYKSLQTGNDVSLYNSSLIASFYYGLSLRLKF